MYVHLHVKYPLFLSNFNKPRISSTGFRKILKYYFHGNQSSGIMRTNGNDVGSSHLSQFCGPKNSQTLVSWYCTCQSIILQGTRKHWITVWSNLLNKNFKLQNITFPPSPSPPPSPPPPKKSNTATLLIMYIRTKQEIRYRCFCPQVRRQDTWVTGGKDSWIPIWFFNGSRYFHATEGSTEEERRF